MLGIPGGSVSDGSFAACTASTFPRVHCELCYDDAIGGPAAASVHTTACFQNMDRIGRYEIVRELGRGAMGVVYLAVDPTIGRQVAIKTIRLGEVDDPEERTRLRERLFREARSAGILSHPGIVTVYDMEEQDDIAFIAMEFVDGPTLDQLLSAREPMPPERMMNILRQTAVAMDYAHQKGIVHRDIKPANIMIASDGAVKITDFGIAKLTTAQQYTQTGTIVGTPNYMSPEQVQGLAVSGRADQFSLTVIAYEMLTGERPFSGEHLTTVVYKIVAEDPPPVQRLNPTLSAHIDTVLRRGLWKKPEGRYATCLEFVNALQAACANTKGWKNLVRGANLNMPTVISETPSEALIHHVASTTEEARMAKRRASRWVLPFVAALIVAVGLIGVIALQFGPGLTLGHGPSAAPAAANPAPTQEPTPSTKSASPPPAPSVDEQKPSPMTPLAANPPAAGAPTSTQPATQPVQQKPETQDPATQPAEKQPEETAKADPSSQSSEHAPAKEPPQKRPAPVITSRPASGPLTAMVMTDPPGANAILDNNPEISCKTPCLLNVTPGRHTATIVREGYQHESREFRITDSPIELPLLNLRAQT